MNVARLNRLVADSNYLLSENALPDAEYEERLDIYLKSIVGFSSSYHSKISQLSSCFEIREMCRNDLFFLLTFVCKKDKLICEWGFDRANEVNANPDGYLDMWPRGFFKSTIITFGKTLQDILISHGHEARRRPMTIGIFSFTRKIAKAFLCQLKREMEANELLINLFSDILYHNPSRDAAKWSENDGIVVRRDSNQKEATIEAWGVLEGQPTSKHFDVLVYDDMVARDTVKTPYIIKQALSAWEDSTNLGTRDAKVRYVGTRKHFNDTYSTMINRSAVEIRLYTPWKEDKTPHLLSNEELDKKRREMGDSTFSSEMLQDPLASESFSFKTEKIGEHNIADLSKLNLFMVCDAANSKKRDSDFSAFGVFGIDEDQNLLFIDGIRDRLNISERATELFKLYKKYSDIISIFYEQVGMQTDIAYYKLKMNEWGRYFDKKFVELRPRLSKEDRIKRIEPWITRGAVLLPKNLPKRRVNGDYYDFIKEFYSEELELFPLCRHDDILDIFAYAVQMIDDEEIKAPNQKGDIDWEDYYKETRAS